MKKIAKKTDLVKGLVSVIVPVYNSEKYIRRCIESILNQTYKKIEIILVDDGSTDGSGKICDEYALSDKRIKVIHQKNKGPAAARNAGIEDSKGEFIFFIDADDFIEKDAISLLIGGYKKSKADLIVGDFKIENYRANPMGMKFFFPSNKLLTKQDITDYIRDYLKKPTGYSLFIYVWGKLFRSSIIKDNNIHFNTDLYVFEDVSFNSEYLRFVSSAYYIENHIYTYVTSNEYKLADMKIYDSPVGYKSALKSIGEFLKVNGVDDNTIRKEIGNACISLTIVTMICFFAPNRNVRLKDIYKLIFKMINDLDIRENLEFYSPSRGDSKILPILMRLKLVWPIMVVCKYKAYKWH